MDHESYALW